MTDFREILGSCDISIVSDFEFRISSLDLAVRCWYLDFVIWVSAVGPLGPISQLAYPNALAVDSEAGCSARIEDNRSGTSWKVGIDSNIVTACSHWPCCS